MPVADLMAPWDRPNLRHVPQVTADPRDFSRAGLAADNRWNDVNVPAVYLASDLHVVVTEFGRRFDDRPAAIRRGARRRDVYEFEVHLDSALDLRNPDVLREIAIRDLLEFIDIDVCRATARNLLAYVPTLQGVIVPSIGFIDHPDERWNVVVYLDRVDVNVALPSAARVHRFDLD